jgi:hypothetical protein
MPLLILITHSPEIKIEHISAALNPAQDTVLQFSSNDSWLIRSNDSPAENKKKLLKLYPKAAFSIFTTPSPDWDTTIKEEKIIEWIRAGLDDYPKAVSISF